MQREKVPSILSVKSQQSSYLDETQAFFEVDNYTECNLPPMGKRIGSGKTIFMIFRSFVGIGVLSLPKVAQTFGITGALVVMPIFAFLILYVIDLMIILGDDLAFKGENTEDLLTISGNQKYIKAFSLLNNLNMYSSVICGCVMSVTFLNWAVCNMHLEHFCDNKTNLHLIATLISVPFGFITHMSMYAYGSFFSAMMITVSLVAILTYNIGMIQEMGISQTANIGIHMDYFAQFFGITCFSIEGISLIFPIRSSMKRPYDFRRLFHWTAAVVIAIYLVFMSVAALALGSSLKDVILFQYGSEFKSMYYLGTLYSIGIIISYPINCHPLSLSIFSSDIGRKIFGHGKENSNKHMITMRCAILLSAVLISYSGINLLDFMDLTGSLFNMTLGFIFPIIFYLNFYWRKIKLPKVLLLLSLAAVCLVLSTWSFIDAIVRIIASKKE